MKKAWGSTKEDLEAFLNSYKYYTDETGGLLTKSLTDELDSINADQQFNEMTILKILLWKVHRYASLGSNLLQDLNNISRLTKEDRLKSRPVLEALLSTDGIDLPMASTLLRFRNPNVFQIIDRRAFRVVSRDRDQYNLYSASPVKLKIDLYFKYLEEIDILCEQTGIKFVDADRILYEFDKEHNGMLKSDPSGAQN